IRKTILLFPDPVGCEENSTVGLSLRPHCASRTSFTFQTGDIIYTFGSNLVFKVRSSSGCGNGGKTSFVFPRFPQPVRRMVSFSSMPTCGRANVFGSFIEYPKEMKTVTQFPSVLVNRFEPHGLFGQDFGEVKQ